VPPRDGREKLPPARCLGLLLRNLALGKEPLYALATWTARWEPALLGLQPDDVVRLGDDRIGRALDRLFQADRASCLTEVVLRTVRTFDIALEQLHNDSTSITFCGAYLQATGRQLAGQTALRITHGHNKDHRPDLKQLLWVLTVSADGAVPIHYRVLDGNTADITTHLATWQALVNLVGRTNFLYVADSKLCDRSTMAAIDGKGGRFLTVLPRSRGEDGTFRTWLQTHQPTWQDLSRARHPRRQDGPENIWRGLESPFPSAEGYRIVWVWNSLLALDDAAIRESRLAQATARLEALQAQLVNPRCRLRTPEAVAAALARALGPAEHWFQTNLREVRQDFVRKVGRGRPGASSRYERQERLHWELDFATNMSAITADARGDGMFPLITNDRQLSLADLLAKYKYQPQLEKRHQQLKSGLTVAPVWLKNEGRIEALLFLFYLALLLHALLERELKRAMVAAGIPRLPLYPEARESAAPSAALLLSLFEDLQQHYLLDHEVLVQTFAPELTPLQRQILELLGINQTDLLATSTTEVLH